MKPASFSDSDKMMIFRHKVIQVYRLYRYSMTVQCTTEDCDVTIATDVMIVMMMTMMMMVVVVVVMMCEDHVVLVAETARRVTANNRELNATNNYAVSR